MKHRKSENDLKNDNYEKERIFKINSDKKTEKDNSEKETLKNDTFVKGKK